MLDALSLQADIRRTIPEATVNVRHEGGGDRVSVIVPSNWTGTVVTNVQLDVLGNEPFDTSALVRDLQQRAVKAYGLEAVVDQLVQDSVQAVIGQFPAGT